MPALEPITPTNVLLYKSIRLAALLDSPTAFGSIHAGESQLTDADWLQRATNLNGDRAIGYLATDAGTACGIAVGLLDEHDPDQADLVSMWVAPTHRRCGIGRSLIETIAAWASARGARTLKLMVTSNNDSAIEFYARNGFSMTGNTEPHPNDPALFEYEMSRLLSPQGE